MAYYCSDKSSSDDELLLLAATLDDNNKKSQRRSWIHDTNKRRQSLGEFHRLLKELELDEKRYYQYFRMKKQYLDDLLRLIENDIRKLNTNWRSSITPKERLAVCLRFLATGDSFQTTAFSFRMGRSTVGKIVEEVCDAIWKNLQPLVMPEPTLEIWKHSAQQYEQLWQFPNCVGSIDGKHVRIQCPAKSGSNYFCYLKKFSIVLLAVVDANYKFIAIDVGAYGKNSDGGILHNSSFGKRLASNSINIPSDKPLPGRQDPVPHVLVGDEAFGLKTYLMRPYTSSAVRNNPMFRTFNYRLCRARRVVENAFGILAAKWRIFHRPIQTKPELADKIVRATCCLHNYLREKNMYVVRSDKQKNLLINSTNTALQPLQTNSRRCKTAAFAVREKLTEFFNSDMGAATIIKICCSMLCSIML